ncbi:hypothetical protein [Bythopirellula polymerisocia]|uniref:DUF5681 domain-containing protein n=1 Tax=Bythopirellula polymerisocia TaxID=2528003 RepID=A0A5C6CW42_9BACT|nr:hypothetical protein [Bythopirellula polymerisocia]TWU27621.1 hypothetical protein Pla144_23980 [Bythopirellula polymerisocia]
MDIQTGDRGRDGKFTKGNPGGPGRPRKEREAYYMKAFCHALGPGALAEIVDAMREKALGGSVAAARLLMEFAMGKPLMQLEVSASEGEEFRVAGMSPGTMQQKYLNRLLEKIQERLDYEKTLEAQGYQVNFSHGVDEDSGK